MASPVPLLNDKHANLKLVESGDYTRYKDQHLIPIVFQDFFTLSAEFPLVFVTNKSGDFIPVALMGLREKQNLYCQTDQWKARVVPLSFGTAPFAIAPADKEGDQFAVLIDEESPQLSDSEGEALFNENGDRSEYLEQRIESIVNVAQQSTQTAAICKMLAEKNLLATQQLQLRHREDGTIYNIDGIYTVSEEALNESSDEEFLDLRAKRMLPLIYCHLASLQQLRRISEMQYEADKASGTSS